MKPAIARLTRLGLCILLAGCQVTDSRNISDDVDALHNIVELDVAPRAIRWEIFGTPEYVGAVQGPTDFVTLVAEVPGLNEAEFKKRAKSGTVWIAPEAARPWISSDFRSLLSQHRNASVDLSSHYNCRAAHGKLRETGQRVGGFICNGSAKGLLYLSLK
ncbi:hypothetical protein [Massilia suwonensis]|uniref:Lipoprotein n=1 Tax=Massilia suwonensis TaxID=648895 RepID=A0ABW0MGP7_9BURK